MESLTHSKWDCKYHVVFVPKYRKKALYGKIRLYLKEVFHELAWQKGCKIESGSMVKDHVYIDTTKVCNFRSYWIIEREECDSYCKTVWREKKEFFRREVLGERICSFNNRA